MNLMNTSRKEKLDNINSINNTSLEDFLNSINSEKLNLEDFWTLGDATSLSEETHGQRLEFYRGPLLYSLISYLKPKKILEFGTGGGYSTLCMAKALHDHDIDSHIYTIDRVGNDEKIDRFFKLPNDISPQKKKISNNEIWKLIAKDSWINKITTIPGYSGIAMDEIKVNNFDFCYIDGVHTYDGTKHDFFSFLNIASKKFSILFDDYIDRDFYGVKQFVDNEVKPYFDLALIDADPEHNLRHFLKESCDYGMIYLSHDNVDVSPLHYYDKTLIASFLSSYRLSDRRVRSNRYKLEQKLPFTKNIKFKFWKK